MGCALYEGNVYEIVHVRTGNLAFAEETGLFSWASRGASIPIAATGDGYESLAGAYMFSKIDVLS